MLPGYVAVVTILEPMLRMSAYVAVIALAYKAIEALNVYINRNLR